ncbi:MAG: glycosyltransferase [Richelia sp. RM2_1_2]|nr:glycosyltransferase [Richelia sp. RM1_1_1]NJO58649.1 glycosyltransferase [Richelia sp. RM2_1_2]
MNKKNPKISVLMSVYNGSSYLRESIESIQNQTFTEFEFIIVEDCSTDNSAEIIAEYAEKDQRIVVIINKENIGLTKSLNKGLKIARGEYIARQDADDVSLPSRLQKEALLLEKHPEISLVSCDIELIDSQGNFIGKCQRTCEPDLVSWYLLFYNRLAGHSQVMFRRQLVIELGGYDENRRYSQDYELWSRMIDVSKIAILPETLLKQRRHSESISASKSSEQKKYSLTQSKQNIEQLIDQEISLEEVEYLRGFWLGHWGPERFPDIKCIYCLNSILLKLYQSFTQQANLQKNVRSDLSKCLRILIGKQFIYWIQAPLTRQQGLLSKFKISYYAFIWYPSGVPTSWLRLCWKTLWGIPKIIVQPLGYRKIFMINK